MTKFVKLWREKDDYFDAIPDGAEVIGMLVPLDTLVDYVTRYEPNKPISEFIDNYSTTDAYELFRFMESNIIEL